MKKKIYWVTTISVIGMVMGLILLTNTSPAWAGASGTDAAFQNAWQTISDLLKGGMGLVIAGAIFLFGIFRFVGNNKGEGIVCIIVALLVKFLPDIVDGLFNG